MPIYEGQKHCQRCYKGMTKTWFILYLPISQFPRDKRLKALLEEMGVKWDYINRDHVISAKLDISEVLLNQRKILTQSGLFVTTTFSCIPTYLQKIHAITTGKIVFFSVELCWQETYASVCWVWTVNFCYAAL